MSNIEDKVKPSDSTTLEYISYCKVNNTKGT